MLTEKQVLDNLRDMSRPNHNSFKVVDIDATQARLWGDTKTALLWQAPAFTYILINMMSYKSGKELAIFTEEADFPVAATDGQYMLLKPSTYFVKYDMAERVFIACHEICHCIFNHCGQMYGWRKRGYLVNAKGEKLPYVEEVMQLAMDYVINAVLVDSKIGKPPENICLDTKFIDHTMSVVDAYFKLHKEGRVQYVQAQGKPGQGKPGQGGTRKMPSRNGQQPFDSHLDPGSVEGEHPVEAMQSRSEAAWRQAVTAAVDAAKAQGKMPAGLERLWKEAVAPKVSWQDHIKGFFARKLGSGGSNWRRAHRQLIVRDIYAPSRSSYASNLVVMGVDTSGSIGQKELDVFFAEMSNLLDDVRPRELHIVWCDAAVHKVDIVTDVSELQFLKAHGGGGTDFRPVFNYIEENGLEPDCLVYLTDLYGPFPKEAPASYPVVWGRTNKHTKPPFGEVVEVDTLSE